MAEILFSDVTTGDVSGKGVFDVLMSSIEDRLHTQYKEGRITGSDYATVYVSALQNAMSQAIQFVLTKQQSDKQADLLSAQIESLERELAIKEEQSAKDLLLKDEQLLASENDRSIKLAQSNQELLVKDEQIIASQNDRDIKLTQSNNDTALKNQQIAESISKVVRENSLATANISLVGSQKSKTDAEKSLVDQKKQSELGQVSNLTTGLLGKQQALIQSQAESFTRRAEVEATKLVADIWQITANTDLADESFTIPQVANGDKLGAALENVLTKASVSFIPS